MQAPVLQMFIQQKDSYLYSSIGFMKNVSMIHGGSGGENI